MGIERNTARTNWTSTDRIDEIIEIANDIGRERLEKDERRRARTDVGGHLLKMSRIPNWLYLDKL